MIYPSANAGNPQTREKAEKSANIEAPSSHPINYWLLGSSRLQSLKALLEKSQPTEQEKIIQRLKEAS